MNQAPVETRRRILFVAEAVTLAHVARPHVLANSLPSDRYEVLFASDSRYQRLFQDAVYQRCEIQSIPSQQFLEALNRGAAVYDPDTLDAYIGEDLEVIDQFQPHAIVGDFRLSLSISARLRKVPYLAITNAYWSPLAKVRFLVPELPMTRWLGYAMGQLVFDLARPVAFAMHARPINRLRKKYGLAGLGSDVRNVYTDADHVLFADWPDFIPMKHLPENSHFIGPLLWSPASQFPTWWEQLCLTKPIVYVSFGSSGDPKILELVLQGLANLPITVIAATAGRIDMPSVPGNALVSDYLPGREATKIANLVICNGGSPSTYEAVVWGKPVISIPTNLDQCLNAANLSRQGLSETLRIGTISADQIKSAASRVLFRQSATEKSDHLSTIGQEHPISFDAFRTCVEGALADNKRTENG